ncbi:kinase-like domain-containing protein [Gigaspora rosea]|uniref:Kinase-like domain-containing protein n=1 Tax=Gigaspora rosea TaxID=44941 RepID=A0A397UWP9_9GLOM|nr:kinase-like domain-containing protein [Gigaspora rosea]
MPYVAPEVLSGEQQFTQKADIYGFEIIMTEMTSGQRPFDGHKFNGKLGADICRGLRPEFAPGTPKCYIELAKKCMNSDPQKRPNAQDINYTIRDWLNNIAISNLNKIKDFSEKIASSNNNEFKDLLKNIASPNNDEFKILFNKIDNNEIKDWLRIIANSNDNEIKNWCIKLASLNNFNEIKDLFKKIASNEFLEADKIIKLLPISKHSDEMYTSKIISTKLILKIIKDLSEVQADSVQMNLDITKI